MDFLNFFSHFFTFMEIDKNLLLFLFSNDIIFIIDKKEAMDLKLMESGQMYLETIYVLTRRSSQVRAIDVGEHMGFSKPSVSRAIGLLKKGGFVTTDDNGFLSLTDMGRETAEKIYERHTVITKILMHLGVDEATAAEDACRIEHTISDRSFETIKKYAENLPEADDK